MIYLKKSLRSDEILSKSNEFRNSVLPYVDYFSRGTNLVNLQIFFAFRENKSTLIFPSYNLWFIKKALVNTALVMKSFTDRYPTVEKLCRPSFHQ